MTSPASSRIAANLPQAALFLLLVLGLAAVTFDYPGTPDVGDFLHWAAVLHADGPVTGYAAIADYPPLGPVLLWAVTGAGRALGLPDFATIKLTIDVFQLVSALIAGIHYRSWRAAALLWLIITPFGALLGYIDTLYLPFILLGTFALRRDEPALAGLLFAIAALIKWQPIILAPIILVYAVSRAGGLNKLTWMLPAAAIAIAVLAIFGLPPCLNAFHGATHDPLFSGQAFNLDWIVTYGLEARHLAGTHFNNGTIKFINALPAPWFALSRALFWLIYLANLAIFTLRRKTPETVLLAMLAAEAIDFTFNTGVHENHAFLLMIFAFTAVFAGCLEPIYLALIAALANANILCFYGLDIIHGPAASAGTVVLSFLQIAICIMVMRAAIVEG